MIFIKIWLLCRDALDMFHPYNVKLDLLRERVITLPWYACVVYHLHPLHGHLSRLQYLNLTRGMGLCALKLTSWYSTIWYWLFKALLEDQTYLAVPLININHDLTRSLELHKLVGLWYEQSNHQAHNEHRH